MYLSQNHGKKDMLQIKTSEATGKRGRFQGAGADDFADVDRRVVEARVGNASRGS